MGDFQVGDGSCRPHILVSLNRNHIQCLFKRGEGFGEPALQQLAVSRVRSQPMVVAQSENLAPESEEVD
ncbi:hypothetical protein ACH4MK_33480 [Streptomyces rochei]|uniref:hypothetical protein n=1 Tax=Streptomyces rochei TaxID=1928 RepID=UPI00378A1977